MGGVALVARGIWWRRGASLVLVLCTALTVAGGAAGPLWGRASQASLLQRALDGARVSDLAWVATGSTDAYGGLTFPPPPPNQVQGDVGRESALPADLDRLFDGATETMSTGRNLQVQPVGEKAFVRPPLGTLLSRDGACARVRLVSGHCPVERTDLVLSDRSAKEVGVRAGDLVQLPELAGELPRKGDPGTALYTVAGIYRVASVRTTDRFWFDSDDFRFAPRTSLGGETLPARLDAILAPPELVASLRSVPVAVERQRALRPGVVTLADADRLAARLGVQAVEVAATNRTVQVSATAARTIAATATGRKLVADTSTFVALQVVVFGLVVMFGLVAVSVAARDTELALAKLRGLRGRRLVTHALAEPVVLVVLAVPLGLLAAGVAVHLLARRVLLPGTPVLVPDAVWQIVAATAAAAVVACALAALRSLRVPVAEQLRRQTAPAGTAGAVTVAVLLTLSVVGLLLVRSLGRGAQAALPALLTPVVVGLAAGLIVGRVVQLLLRVAVRHTHRWPLGPYLAVRRLARRTAVTHTTALVTVATAVSGFAAAAFVVTATQREAQARLDLGAERVVHVAPTTTGALLAASRAVDPPGRWAMAAVQREGPSPLLAVDSGRWTAAFGVPRGVLARPRGLAELVPARVPRPLAVRGTTATLRVASSTVFSSTDVELSVQIRVVTPAGDVQAARFGPPLTALGTAQTLTARIPACARGCTVAGLFLTRRGIGQVTGDVELASLDVGGSSHALSDDEWRPARVDESVPDSAGTSSLSPRANGRGGLSIRFDASASVTPGIVRRDVPTELPAIVGEQTPLNLLGARQLVEGTTLEGGSLPFEIAGRSPALPRTGQGALVDLELMSRVEAPRDPALDFQVWLGAAAPADAPQRLAAAGLKVADVETRSERRAELDRAEPARAQLLLLGAGAAVLLAGVAGTATVLAAAARRRAIESAALHAMAVPGRTVRGSAVLEDVVLLLPGVVVGAGCAASLVVALTPVLAEVTGAATVVSGTPALADVLLPVLAAAAATALLLVPVVLAVTRPAGDETPLRVAA